MKKYLILVLAVLGACQDDNEITYRVDPSLAPYVDVFYAEVQERGVTLPQNLVAEFGDVQAIVKGETHNGQNYLRVSKTMFDGFSEVAKEAQIVYGLAGIFFAEPAPGAVGISLPYDRESAFDSFIDNL